MTTPTAFLPCLAWLATMILLVPSAPAAPANPDPLTQEYEDAVAWLKTHGLSEEEFIRAGNEPGTAVLDASDPGIYEFLHIKGALHLTVSAMDAKTLVRVLPDRNTRILIYQNNNSKFREKMRAAVTTDGTGIPFAGRWSGVNVDTCVALRRCGYNQVYELATYVEIDCGTLPLDTNILPIRLDQPVTLSLLAPASPTRPFPALTVHP